jgi:TatD DNase family protein
MLPHLRPEDDGLHLEKLDALLQSKRAIAVGECGLDGPSAQAAPVERQLSVLAGHFELAQQHGLPVLVHCHRLQPALVEFLQKTPLPDAGVLLHSYSGGPDLAKFYRQRGCWFSFAGPVTWPEARKPLAALKEVGIDRLMLETDAPDQSPYPHRGQRSEPGYLPLIARAAATALEIPLSEAAERTSDNARKFFGGAFT